MTLGRTYAEAAAKDGTLGMERVVDASDVPCDSLAMLANAAAARCDRVPEASMEWSLEPAYEVWTFRRTRNDGNAKLLVGVHPRQSVTFATVPCRELSLVVWRALRRLESDPVWRAPPDEMLSAWSWPFPSAETLALGKKLGR